MGSNIFPGRYYRFRFIGNSAWFDKKRKVPIFSELKAGL